MLMQHRKNRPEIDFRTGRNFSDYFEFSIINVNEADYFAKFCEIEWQLIEKPVTD